MSRWLDRAEDTSPDKAAKQGFSGIILVIAGGIIAIIEAMFEGISEVIRVLSDLRDFMAAFFTQPIQILEGTAAHTVFELTAGDWAFFGPFTFAAGVVAIAVAWWAWNILDPDIPFLNQLLFWRR